MKFEEVYGRTLVLSQADAAEGVSERTFQRWCDRYEAEGAEGLYDWAGPRRAEPARQIIWYMDRSYRLLMTFGFQRLTGFRQM